MRSLSKTTRKTTSKTTSASPKANIVGNAESSHKSTLRAARTREERFQQRFQVDQNTPETVLQMQMQNWSSQVYQHFTMPPKISKQGTGHSSEKVSYVFHCKKNPSVFVRRDRLDESTSNLMRHVQRCEPGELPQVKAITAFAHGSTLSTGRLRFLLVKWVTKNYHPYSIVEDEELLEIFQMLDDRVQTPSRSTLSRDVQEMFSVARVQVQDFFKTYAGKVHIGLDGWTSPNVFSYLGITVHFMDKGDMKTMILDFVKLTASHSGSYLAEKLHECLMSYNLEDKLLGLVCDNASNNNTMVESLETRIPSWGGAPMRTRCFAHILNLVVKSILSVFTVKRKRSADGQQTYEDPSLAELLKDISDEADEEDDIAQCEDEDDGRAAFDEALIGEIEEMESKLATADYEDEIRLAQVSVEKLKSLAKAIFHSSTLRESLKEQCALAEPPIPYSIPVRPVATRWNSLTMTIKSAKSLRPALSALVDLTVHNRNKSSRLRRFALDDEEWRMLDQLLPLLDRFLEATELISVSSYPLVHSVIPLIDQLTESLITWSQDTNNHPAVRIASERGLKVMNKYYGLTDDSVVYRIAMIMHPRRKLSYFRAAKWPEEWIQTSVKLARDEWEQNYKPKEVAKPAAVEKIPKTGSYFKHLESYAVDDSFIDQFEQYIATPTVAVKDPIGYWYTLQQSGNPLAQMALNFLTCPAASTDVERAFSRGRLTVSRTRHSLSDESTRASTVLSSWFQHPQFIPEQEIIDTFGNKSRRPNNGRVDDGDMDVDEHENEENFLESEA